MANSERSRKEIMETAMNYNRMEDVKEFDNSKVGVKGLSDSGITMIPKFFVHLPDTLTDLKSSSKTKEIPIIDLAKIGCVGHRSTIIDKVKEVAKTWGFFQVVNHGVPVSVLDSTTDAIKAFHELPTEEKAKHYMREENLGVMYSCNADLYRSKAATWHDTLQVWLSPDPAEESKIPEVCRKEVLQWDSYAKMVAETVMGLLSEGLGLTIDKFKELTFLNSRLFLGHYYPYCPQPDLTMGITSHTDSPVLTVLLQNQVQGLQVKHEEEWVDVKPVPGGLIINIGDFLQIVSNGGYQSVEHRVLANSCSKPRISIVVFFHVTEWKGSGYFGPLPELLTQEKPAIYRDFTKQEFVDNFYSKGIDSKSLIENFKL